MARKRKHPDTVQSAPEVCPLCAQAIKEHDACYTAHPKGHVHWECWQQEKDKAAANWQGNLMTVSRFIRAHGQGQEAQTALTALCNLLSVDEAALKLRLGWDDKAAPQPVRKS